MTQESENSLQRMLRTKDIKITLVSQALGIAYETAKKSVQRMSFPVGTLSQLAILLGVKVEALHTIGVREGARGRRRKGSSSCPPTSIFVAAADDLLPMMSNIVKSELASLTGEQFMYLIKMQQKHSGKVPSPELIKHLIEYTFNKDTE